MWGGAFRQKAFQLRDFGKARSKKFCQWIAQDHVTLIVGDKVEAYVPFTTDIPPPPLPLLLSPALNIEHTGLARAPIRPCRNSLWQEDLFRGFSYRREISFLGKGADKRPTRSFARAQKGSAV